jgi:hypothetical protein
MRNLVTRSAQLLLATVVFVGCAFVSERALMDNEGPLLSSAEARIGRPLTPMSYAGVARRTTRRAVAVGAAVAAPVVVAPVVVGPRCVQAVDPYGRLYTRCY